MCSASPRFISLHFLGTTNSNSGTPTNRPTNTLESHSKTRIRWFVTSFLFCLLRSFGNSSSAQIETQHRRAQQYHRAHAALTCSIVTQHRFHSLRIASIYQNVARSLNNLRCYAPIRFDSIQFEWIHRHQFSHELELSLVWGKTHFLVSFASSPAAALSPTATSCNN
jgi:hypothetical protein